MDTLSDAQFAEHTLTEGGATRQIRTLKAATGKGYAVGGRAGIKEVRVPADEFSQKHVGEHLAALHIALGDDPSAHQGAWREPPNVVLDASDVYRSKDVAINTGLRRGERAIYDIAKDKDFNLPRLNRVKIK